MPLLRLLGGYTVRRGGPDSLKSVKDAMQAEFLIRVLVEDRPDEMKETYQGALAIGTRWQERIGRALGRMPEIANILKEL